MNIMKLTTDTDCRDVVKIELVYVTRALQTVSVNCHSKAMVWTYHDFLVHIIREDFVRTPRCPSVSCLCESFLRSFLVQNTSSATKRCFESDCNKKQHNRLGFRTTALINKEVAKSCHAKRCQEKRFLFNVFIQPSWLFDSTLYTFLTAGCML